MKRIAITSDWWAELSPEGQKEYLAEHPDSKKAQEVRQAQAQQQHKPSENKPGTGIGPESHSEKPTTEKPEHKEAPAQKPAAEKKEGPEKPEKPEGEKKASPPTVERKVPSEMKKPETEKPAEPETKTPAPAPAPAPKAEHKDEGEDKGGEEAPSTESAPDAPAATPSGPVDPKSLPKSAMIHKLKAKIKRLHGRDKEFFEQGGDVPNSPQRKSIAQHVRGKHGLIISHLKQQAHEWKSGVNALHKLGRGKPLDDHDKHALKSLTKDLIVTTGMVAFGGGLSHGVILAVKHMGLDMIRDSVLKAAAHAVVTKAALMHHVLATGGDPDKGDADSIDDRLMEALLEEVTKFIESGDIPEEAWSKAMSEMDMKD
jgi:hypothetical protein